MDIQVFYTVLTALLAITNGQVGFYGQNHNYPLLAYRFRNTTENPLSNSTVNNTLLSNTINGTSNSSADIDLNTRVGGNDVETPSTTTIRLPIDAMGDAELVKRISQWPKDKQPFWYKNWVQIEQHRNQTQLQSTSSKGSFQG